MQNNVYLAGDTNALNFASFIHFGLFEKTLQFLQTK